MTTDWGVESQIADAAACDLKQAFPYFNEHSEKSVVGVVREAVGRRQDSEISSPAGSEIGEAASPHKSIDDTDLLPADGSPPIDTSFTFPLSLWIPGTLHIISDGLEDLTK